MDKLNKVEKEIKKTIKKYIDANSYLLMSDDSYTKYCHLIPRLVSNAVETACSQCNKKRLLDNQKDTEMKKIYFYAQDQAIEYIEIKIKKIIKGGKIPCHNQ